MDVHICFLSSKLSSPYQITLIHFIWVTRIMLVVSCDHFDMICNSLISESMDVRICFLSSKLDSPYQITLIYIIWDTRIMLVVSYNHLDLQFHPSVSEPMDVHICFLSSKLYLPYQITLIHIIWVTRMMLVVSYNQFDMIYNFTLWFLNQWMFVFAFWVQNWIDHTKLPLIHFIWVTRSKPVNEFPQLRLKSIQCIVCMDRINSSTSTPATTHCWIICTST